MNNNILVGVYILMAIYIVYRLFTFFYKPSDKKFENEINEILTSDKYKVKGQYDE